MRANTINPAIIVPANITQNDFFLSNPNTNAAKAAVQAPPKIGIGMAAISPIANRPYFVTWPCIFARVCSKSQVKNFSNISKCFRSQPEISSSSHKIK